MFSKHIKKNVLPAAYLHTEVDVHVIEGKQDLNNKSVNNVCAVCRQWRAPCWRWAWLTGWSFPGWSWRTGWETNAGLLIIKPPLCVQSVYDVLFKHSTGFMKFSTVIKLLAERLVYKKMSPQWTNTIWLPLLITNLDHPGLCLRAENLKLNGVWVSMMELLL